MMHEAGKMLPFPPVSRPAACVTLVEGSKRPDEETLRSLLADEGYQAVKWSNDPATGFPPHAHIYPELLWVVSGSLTVFLLAGRRMLELTAGDRIEIPAGLSHGTMAGSDGAVYLLATR